MSELVKSNPTMWKKRAKGLYHGFEVPYILSPTVVLERMEGERARNLEM